MSKDTTLTRQDSLSFRTGVILIGNIAYLTLKLILPIILVRLISKDAFGTYRQTFLVYTTLTTIFLLGIPQSIYYFVPKLSKEKQWDFLIQSLLFLEIISILIALLMWNFSGLIAQFFNNPELQQYLKIISFYVVFLLPAECFIPLMICLDKQFLAATRKVFFGILFLIAVILPLALGYTLKHVFYALVLTGSIQLFIVLFHIKKAFTQSHFSKDFSLLKSQLNYSLPIGFSSILGILTREIDKYMISFYFLPQQFAVYAIGARELPFVQTITYSVSNVIQPKLVSYYDKNDLNCFFDLWHRSIRKTALVICPLFVFSLVFAGQIILALYTNAYLESVVIFRIYLLALPLRITTYGTVLLAMGSSREVMISTVIALIANIILNVFLIQVLGLAGAAIATTIVVYIGVIYLLYQIRVKSKWSVYKLLPWQVLLRIFLVSILCGLVVYPLLQSKLSPFLVVVCGLLLYYTLFYLIARKFDILRTEEINQIKEFLRIKSVQRRETN